MSNQRGFSLIELLIVVAIIGIIAAIAIPNFTQSRIAANEASAISTVRTICTAQITYAATFGNGIYADNLASLMGTRLLDTGLGGIRNGYTFVSTGTAAGTFTVTATPQGPSTGRRTFTCDETGVIKGNGQVIGSAAGGS